MREYRLDCERATILCTFFRCSTNLWFALSYLSTLVINFFVIIISFFLQDLSTLFLISCTRAVSYNILFNNLIQGLLLITRGYHSIIISYIIEKNWFSGSHENKRILRKVIQFAHALTMEHNMHLKKVEQRFRIPRLQILLGTWAISLWHGGEEYGRLSKSNVWYQISTYL